MYSVQLQDVFQVLWYQADGHVKSLKKTCLFLHDILLLSFFFIHPLHQAHGNQNDHRQNHGNGTSEIPVSNGDKLGLDQVTDESDEADGQGKRRVGG